MNALEAVQEAIVALRDEAELLETWADASERGGWSTHQAKQQRDQAIKLRQVARRLASVRA